METQKRGKIMSTMLRNILSVIPGTGGLKKAVTFLTEQTYDLTVIEDMDTPLAGAPKGPNFYMITVLVLLIVAICALIVVHTIRRNKVKERLLELRRRTGNNDTHVPLKIREMEDEISQTETNITAEFI